MFTEDATKRSGETQKKQTDKFSSFFKIDFCFLRKKKEKTFQKWQAAILLLNPS